MTNHLDMLFVFLASLTVTFLILPRLTPIATKIGLMDYPNKRKIHTNPKPLIGGISMVIGVSLSCLFVLPISSLWEYYVGVAVLLIVGVFDDIWEVSHRLKFFAQILVSVIMVYAGDTLLLSFGDPFALGALELGSLAVLVTVFCTVGVINAINMIDGLDGLAGGVSLISLIPFAILAFINDQMELMLLSLALSGAVFAFLKYNWNPSRVFMGDAGSLCLGFSLTFLSIAITQKEGSVVSPVAPLLILGVPVVDTVTIMIKRMMRGKSPFHADKYHFHHILLRFGLNKKDAVKVILVLSSGFSLLALMGTLLRAPDYFLFALFSAYFLTHFVASFHLKEMLRFKRRLLRRGVKRFIGEATRIPTGWLAGQLAGNLEPVEIRKSPASVNDGMQKLSLSLPKGTPATAHASSGYRQGVRMETILVAEDDAAVRGLIKTMLEDVGYKVIEAVDGDCAVKLFRENKDSIKLLLLDVVMPKKNGRDAYEEMKILKPEVKGIFMSGYARDILDQVGVSKGSPNFIPKPFSPKELFTKVRELAYCS